MLGCLNEVPNLFLGVVNADLVHSWNVAWIGATFWLRDDRQRAMGLSPYSCVNR